MIDLISKGLTKRGDNFLDSTFKKEILELSHIFSPGCDWELGLAMVCLILDFVEESSPGLSPNLETAAHVGLDRENGQFVFCRK